MQMEEKSEEVRAEKESFNLVEGYYARYLNGYNDEKFNSIVKKNNFISLMLKFIGYAIIIIDVVVYSVITIETEKISLVFLLIIFLISCGLSLGFFAFAEIIQILHDIRFKLWIK